MVAILMGSDSDLSLMQPALEVLREFGIEFEVEIMSAHRTPQKTAKYAASAKERGIKVIIAGAGGAAHLPGFVAAFTTLPVIGVPLDTTPLKGQDSLHSIVQMPSGVPVATVGINAAKNAALLALQILALSEESLAERLEEFKTQMAASVEEKSAHLKSKLG